MIFLLIIFSYFHSSCYDDGQIRGSLDTTYLKSHRDPSWVIKIMIPLAAFASVISVPLFFIVEQENGDCVGKVSTNDVTNIFHEIYPKIHIPSLIGASFLLIVLVNILIVYKLSQSKSEVTRHEIEATIQLFLISFCFFLLKTAPIATVIIAKYLTASLRKMLQSEKHC